MQNTSEIKQELNALSLDFVRYANVWEDVEVLLRGLDLLPGKRILSVCSAGDNCFGLLTTQPEVLVAVDVNPAQLHLTHLKAAAIRQLEYAQVLSFLGFTESEERVQIFEKIKSSLSIDTRKYWEIRTELIEKGVIHCGKFEKYFRLFAKWVLPLIHSKKRIAGLLEKKDADEQIQYYDKVWNSRRWKWLFKIFFGRQVMGRFGRDPAFFDQVRGSVGEEIYQRSAAHLGTIAAQNNPFLQYSLTGHFAGKLPFYLRPENFAAVRANLDKLEIHEGYVQDIAKQMGNFDAMNLSNIFEYMPEDIFQSAVAQLNETAATGCRFGYWNLLVPRIMATAVEGLTHQEKRSKILSKTDNGFFYGGFKLDKKIH